MPENTLNINPARASQPNYFSQVGSSNVGTGAAPAQSTNSTNDVAIQTVNKIVWQVIDTFRNQTGLRNAIKDFIDTNESGIKLQRDFINGRSKIFTFNFKHSPSPSNTEVGIFKFKLRYPADLTAGDNMANPGLNTRDAATTNPGITL